MKYQALLLALVILISLLISPNGLRNLAFSSPSPSPSVSETSTPVQTSADNSGPSPFYFFVNDLGSFISGQAVALAKNLSSAGRLLAANLNALASGPSAAVIKNQTQPLSSVDPVILASQTGIAPTKTFSCDFDETQLPARRFW